MHSKAASFTASWVQHQPGLQAVHAVPSNQSLKDTDWDVKTCISLIRAGRQFRRQFYFLQFPAFHFPGTETEGSLYLSTWHDGELCGKSVSGKDCLDQVGLWADLWGTFLIELTEEERPSTLNMSSTIVDCVGVRERWLDTGIHTFVSYVLLTRWSKLLWVPALPSLE